MTNLRTAAQQALEALIENARLLGATQAKKGFGCYSQEDARLERAWHEGIAKHSAALRAALAEPVQSAEHWKHVANLWVDPETQDYVVDRCDHPLSELIPVYTAPPQRKPLTDEEMLDIIDDTLEGGSLVDVARAIERAHGIGEQP